MPIYDVENRFSYYKNYSDNILVGPPQPAIGSSIWQRSVSGSVVSGSEEYKAATFLSDYVFTFNNQFFRSGEVRYLRLSSAAQKIEDSIVPSIISIYTTGSSAGSGSIARDNGSLTDELSNGNSLLFSNDGNVITGGIGFSGQRVNNTEWKYSFPFEKKYQYTTKGYQSQIPVYTYAPIHPKGESAVEQLLWRNSTSTVTTTFAAYYSIYFTKVTNEVKTYYQYVERTGIDGSYPQYSFTSKNESLASKIIFGIKPKPVSSPANDLNFLQGSIVFYTGSYIEGWRYGLYNGIPTKFSCVFRQNHYGQPMDMLEGRPYTKTYNNPEIGGPLDEAGGINFISASALAGESNNWLTASIYGGTNVAAAYTVNPYGSGIFDKEYRASQPWHDDDPRLGT